MDYLDISIEDACAMARRHHCYIIDSDLDDGVIPMWASVNYGGNGAPGDIDELCYHACCSVGAYKKEVISEEMYLQAMKNIDHLLGEYYKTSLKKEWFYVTSGDIHTLGHDIKDLHI